MRRNELAEHLTIYGMPRNEQAWKTLLQLYISLLPNFSDAAATQFLSNMASCPGGSPKQLQLLGSYMASLPLTINDATPEWLDFVLSVYAFVLQHPAGTEEECRLACTIARQWARKHGELPLMLFYNELEMAGYPASSIHGILLLAS